MSLINEALKKAQRQRDGGAEQPAATANEAGTAPSGRITRREKPAGFRSQMLMVAGGGIAVVVLALVIGGIWFWRSSQKAEPLPAKPEIAAAHTPAPVVTAPVAITPVATTPVAPPAAAEMKPVPAAVVETAKPVPLPPPAVAASPTSAQFTLPLSPAPTQAASATTAPSAPAPIVADVPKPAERPKPSVHMVTIIENLRVAGIRAAGEDSKVLMNDRVYRLNDIVDHDLNLRLTGVTTKSLTFEDDHGMVYTRNF